MLTFEAYMKKEAEAKASKEDKASKDDKKPANTETEDKKV